MTKQEALKNYVENELGEKVEDMTNTFESTFEVFTEKSSYEFNVLTEEEADEATEEYIKETALAFNSSFWLDYTDIENTSEIQEAFTEMQGQLCESANAIVLGCIGEDRFDKFAENAILEDGRGHFLSFYDGEEKVYRDNENYFLIYRNN